MRHLLYGILSGILVLSAVSESWAQEGNDDRGPSQFGVFMGRVLPNNVTTSDEIFPLYGIRYSIPSGRRSYYDFSGYFGKGEDVTSWQSVAAGIRMDIPVETLIGHAGVGGEFTRLEEEGVDPVNAFGVHFIGGLMTLIGGNVLARFDMKLSSKPGTSLYFAFGLVFNLDSSPTEP